MRIVPWLVLLLLCACTNHRYFAPRENRNGTGPGGHPAAVYPIGGAPVLGEVRVWSEGSRMVEVDGADVVEVHVGFELENTGAETLAIDVGSVVCDELWVGDQRLAPLAPFRSDGIAEARPGATSRLEFSFRPEPAGRARDVAGFTLRFSVTAGGQPVFTQVTPFVPYRVPDDRWRDDWYWGRGWWGPGISFGFYHRSWCH